MEREAKTIDELKQIYQEADKKIIKALDYAIVQHGRNSLAFFVIGRPSKNPKSLCYKEAKEHGFKDFEAYPIIIKGSPNQGIFLNLVVKINMNKPYNFLLFAGQAHYPEGGAKDYEGKFETIQEALKAHIEILKRKEYKYDDPWANIFCLNSFKIIKMYNKKYTNYPEFERIWEDVDGYSKEINKEG